MYLWPSSIALALYIASKQEQLTQYKNILELGAGTAFPSLVAAKCGAQKIFASDDLQQNPTLKTQLQHNIQLNQVQDVVTILDLPWAQFGYFAEMHEQIDLLLAADCLYDDDVFEDFVATVAFLLKPNTGTCWMTYHDRNEDRNLVYLLSKWNLVATKHALPDCSEQVVVAAGFSSNDALRIEQSVSLYHITRLP